VYTYCSGINITCDQTPVGCLYISAVDEFAVIAEAHEICESKNLHLASPISMADFEVLHDHMLTIPTSADGKYYTFYLKFWDMMTIV